MRRTLFAAVVATAALFGCHDATPSGPDSPALARGGEADLGAAANKVAICHAAGRAEDPKFREISVGASAVADHLNDHGDYLVTARTPCPPPPVVDNVSVCTVETGVRTGGTFVFDVNGESLTIAGGACVTRSFRVGTDVTVREAVPTNTVLEQIAVWPALAGTGDVATATANIVAGDDVATVVFANRALLGQLRICKTPRQPGVMPGTEFEFAVTTGTPQSTRYYSAPAAPSGYCAPAGAYPFGTRVSIVEQPYYLYGTHVSDIGVTPADRLVPGSIDLSARRVDVIIGEGNTDVHYVNERPVGDVRVCVAGEGIAGTAQIHVLAAYLDRVLSRSVPVNTCVDGFTDYQALLIGSDVFFRFFGGQLPLGVRVASITVQPSDLVTSPGPIENSLWVRIGSVTTVTFTLTR